MSLGEWPKAVLFPEILLWSRELISTSGVSQLLLDPSTDGGWAQRKPSPLRPPSDVVCGVWLAQNQPPSKHPEGKEKNGETNRAGRDLEMRDGTQEKKSEIKTVGRLLAHHLPKDAKILRNASSRAAGLFKENEIRLVHTEHCSLFTRFKLQSLSNPQFYTKPWCFYCDLKL